MPKYRLIIAYDGTDFAGWQAQPQYPTIQGTLTVACSKMNGNTPVTVEGAGRTDAGVHARGQVASIVMEKNWNCRDLCHSLNSLLPPSIAIVSVTEAPMHFDARRHAQWRRYSYHLVRNRLPLRARYTWRCDVDLDITKMQQAAQTLLGRHDFTSYSSSLADELNSTVRLLKQLDCQATDDGVRIDAVASSFLTRMVRNLAWTLARVGRGRIGIEVPYEILQLRQRGFVRGEALANGLCLEEVGYPDAFE